MMSMRLMRAKKIISSLTNAYGLLRPDGLLQIQLFQRAYVCAYFQYKKFVEDPFFALTLRQPRLFHNGDILDIGANIGYTACVFSKAMKPGSKVFAFEPDAVSCAVLRDVVRRKSLNGQIEILNTAVGNSDGELTFWHNNKHPADHRVVTKRFSGLLSKHAKVSTIPAITIDSFVANRGLQNISFIKIDVQGYELAVCEGMTRTLEKFTDLCCCIEYSPHSMEELGFEPRKLLDFFRERKYNLYILRDGNPDLAKFSLENSLPEVGYVDLLFARNPLA